MKFKHGQKVKCEIQCNDIWHKIDDAKISMDEDGSPFICHNNENCDGASADDKLGYEYSWALNSDFTNISVCNLRPVEKMTFDNLEIGTELKDEDGDSKWVLAICGDIIGLSNFNDKNKFGEWYIKQELEKYGYTIVQPEPVSEDEKEALKLLKDKGCKIIKE